MYPVVQVWLHFSDVILSPSVDWVLHGTSILCTYIVFESECIVDFCRYKQLCRICTEFGLRMAFWYVHMYVVVLPVCWSVLDRGTPTVFIHCTESGEWKSGLSKDSLQRFTTLKGKKQQVMYGVSSLKMCCNLVF